MAAGATALVMPCNTAHHGYRELSVGCPVPFLSIVEAGCDAAARVAPRGGTVGIAATRATLAARLFDAPLARHGLKADLPGQDELLRWLLPAIAAVKAGQIAARSALLDQLLDSFAARGTTHVLLACTELPIALAASVAPRTGECIDSTLALARLTVSYWRTLAAPEN
jgi:aspartate racemase